MSHEPYFGEHLMMQIEGLVAPRATFATEVGTNDATVLCVTERLNEITRQSRLAESRYTLHAAQTGACALIGFGCAGKGLYSDNWPLLATGILLCAVGLLALCGASLAYGQDTPTFDADEIARLGGTRAIPALFMALQSPLRERHEWAIYKALTMLLPFVTPGDANLLTLDNHRTIYKWLDSDGSLYTETHYPDALRVAALDALERIGYSSAIPYVERLTRLFVGTRGKAKVRQAAIDCLPILQANCAEVEAARTLLRASYYAETQPDTLLRPANGGADANPAELLRVAERPENREQPIG